MKNKDALFIVKKHLFSKQNIIMFIAISIISLIIFICLTLMNFALITYIQNEKYAFGTALVVNGENLEKVKDIPHVTFVSKYKYLNGTYQYVSKFDKDSVKGELDIYAYVNPDMLKIVKGKALVKSGEMICSENFYPYSEYVNMKIDIRKNLFIKGHTLIGESISLESQNEKFQDEVRNFKIVGTYKNVPTEPANTCYILPDDFEWLKSDCATYNDGDNGEEICNEYKGVYILVDNRKNMDSVISTLSNMKYKVQEVFEYNDNLYYLICNTFIC